MPYPDATDSQCSFFAEHGYLVVEDAIDPTDLGDVMARCEYILENKEELAYDWTWEKGKTKEEREFNVVQAGCAAMRPEFANAPFRLWAGDFASALMQRRVDFWYDQFIAKPPRSGAATMWHQDEAYWGRRLWDAGITCWMPFHDVDPSNGCMHFIDRGHQDGVLVHQQPPNIQSDLLYCEPDVSRIVSCPISVGGVTFHHGRTPHMTPSNSTDGWRKVLTQHFKDPAVDGEGDHYPWKVVVEQFTGRRERPASR